MKNQFTYLLLTFLLPFTAFTQNKFSLGINGAFQINKMNVDGIESQSGIEEKGEIGLGYAAGLQIQYDLTEKMFLRSGATYQNLKHRHKIEGLRFGTDLMFGTASTTSSIENNITISSIGIPVDIGFRLPTKNEKMNFLIGFGGSININLNDKSEATLLSESMPNEEVTPNNQVDFSIFSVGIFTGMEIPLSEKTVLGIEPNIKFTPNDFTLTLFASSAKTTFEAGLTVRIRMK